MNTRTRVALPARVAAGIAVINALLYAKALIPEVSTTLRPLAILELALLLLLLGSSIWLLLRPWNARAAALVAAGLALMIGQAVWTVGFTVNHVDTSYIAVIALPLVGLAFVDLIGLILALAAHRVARTVQQR